MLMKEISCCGINCGECEYFGSICVGCNKSCGKPFYIEEGKSCRIYECVKNKKCLENCGKCEELPCDLWMNTRDPKFTDEEFLNYIKERIKTLKENN